MRIYFALFILLDVNLWFMTQTMFCLGEIVIN